LYIKVKAFLVKMPPGGAAISWDSPGEPSWYTWRRSLKETLESPRIGWSDRLWLIPTGDWLAPTVGETRATMRTPGRPTSGTPDESSAAGGARPPIVLRFRIEYVDDRDDAHVVVNCSRLSEVDDRTSNMEAPFDPISRRRSCWGEESYGNLDSNDLNEKPGGQIAAVHEFGHCIGLNHVNPSGAGDEEYGQFGTVQRADIMGVGNVIAPWHAYPWCRRLRLHLGGDQPTDIGWHSRRPLKWETRVGDRTVLWTPTTQRPPGA
jgi:hypothetical protein